MIDETKRGDSGAPRANSLWETIRRNGDTVVLIVVFIAGFQYQTAVTARMIEQLADRVGARIDSLEISYAASIAAMQENRKQLIEQLDARMTSLENSTATRMTSLEDSTVARMTSLENSFSATITAVQENQRQMAAHMKAIEDVMRDLRAIARSVLDSLARIETKLGIADPQASAETAAGETNE